jgi:alpha-tubulin suppressor-like RCC1 family protein
MGMRELPAEILTHVCQHLGLSDLVRVAATCKHLRHGGLETVELPTEAPVVTVLCKRAFHRPELIPSVRSDGCSESWVAYLARCARQRRCREAPCIAAGGYHSLCVDADGRLLSFGKGAATGHADVEVRYALPAPVHAVAEIRIWSVAAGSRHSLVLCRDGRIFSWGKNKHGQLGHEDRLARPSPAPVEGLQGVCNIAASLTHSFAVTPSGTVFTWGRALRRGAADEDDMQDSLRPIIVEGFEDVRVRRVCAGDGIAFAIGEDGEVFSWGEGINGLLGHGNTRGQPSRKRVEALRGLRISSVSVGIGHALALTEDGLVYM